MFKVDKLSDRHVAQTPSALSFALITSMESLDAVMYLAKRSHEESRFSYIAFSHQKVKSIVERVLGDPKRHAIMICYEKQKPIGFVYCSIGEYHIGIGTLLTTIHNINVLKEVRHTLKGGRAVLGLLKGVDSWSRARSSKEILFHVTSDIELSRTHKFIKRMGYRFIGGSYARNIE